MTCQNLLTSLKKEATGRRITISLLFILMLIGLIVQFQQSTQPTLFIAYSIVIVNIILIIWIIVKKLSADEIVVALVFGSLLAYLMLKVLANLISRMP